MGVYDREDDDDDFDAEDDGGSQTLQQLRRVNRQQAKQLKELQASLADFQKQQRANSIGDVLKSKGLNPKLAKYFPSDVDPTPESVQKWLDEDGELFGVTKEEQQAPQIPPADVAAMRQMDLVGNAVGTQSAANSIEAQILAATSREELLKLLGQG